MSGQSNDVDYADSDDDKSLIQFIQIKKEKTVLKKVQIVKVGHPEILRNVLSKSEGVTDKRQRSNKNRYKCSDCEQFGICRIFKLKESLEAHIFSKHSEDSKPLALVCDVCDSDKPTVFASKKPFLSHMMIQHSVVVFICDICTAIFKLKANYKTHVANHNVQPKRAFKCDTCNGLFVNKAGYAAHRKRFPGPHIKQICPNCGTSFSREKHMKNHRCKTLLLKEAKERLEKASEKKIKVEHKETAISSTAANISYQSVDGNPVMMQEIDEAPETEQVILAGNMMPDAQVLHIEISESDQPHQVYQVNVADWNMVAPYVVRDPLALSDNPSSD